MPNDALGQAAWKVATGIVVDWAASGHVVGDPPVPVSGSDVYEVLPGGYFRRTTST